MIFGLLSYLEIDCPEFTILPPPQQELRQFLQKMWIRRDSLLRLDHCHILY